MLKEPRMVFGFLLLLLIAVIALTIALGKVTQQESYGLDIVLGCLSTLAGGFANYAFGRKDDSKDP